MANVTKLTDKKREKFIDLIRETANVSKAAAAIGVSRTTVYRLKESDRSFSELWDEAYQSAVDALEEEARRRALTGVGEPVFYQGEVVGTIQKYSDTLLIFLLKAARPEKYRENINLKLGWEELARRDGQDPESISAELEAYFFARLVRSGGSGVVPESAGALLGTAEPSASPSDAGRG